MTFNIPNASERTTIIGATGTGKTVLGGQLLSLQRLDKRPWICIDFKDEELWDIVGKPTMQELRLQDKLPKRPGLYRLSVNPGQEDELEEWFWKVWRKGNIGLFVDEVSLVPQRNAFKAILRQGRSKFIPVIACTQRPVDCDREVFSESQYICVFRVDDERDYKIIKGFTRGAAIERPRPKFHSWWYDKAQAKLYPLNPAGKPDSVAKSLRERAPQPRGFASFFLR